MLHGAERSLRPTACPLSRCNDCHASRHISHDKRRGAAVRLAPRASPAPRRKALPPAPTGQEVAVVSRSDLLQIALQALRERRRVAAERERILEVAAGALRVVEGTREQAQGA